MQKSLLVKEFYKSIQGESSYSGLPCGFVRLSGCPLRCRWCDTVYGFKGGDTLSIDEILENVKAMNVPLVELTGGEPLAQENSIELLNRLCKEGYKVLLETSGSISIENVPDKTHIIMDLKCPDSQMSEHNLFSNLDYLKLTDEIKFVVASKSDLTWAHMMIHEYGLDKRFSILISPAWGLVKPQDLVEWMLEYNIPARLNLQIHKYIWGPKAKSV
ncbi:MAG: radical SAM protein [Oligoflexales bacterium]